MNVVLTNFINNKGYGSNSNLDIYNEKTAASIMSIHAYSKVVDHFPRAAWKQDLLEAGITVGITLITIGISTGISYAGIQVAHYINMLVGSIVGGAGGLINAITYFC